MASYYNDNEPYAAAWLRNLIAAGLIPAGDVDERPIREVMPDDIRHYTQCHFFAGIGGWACALRLAGVADLPCWTGSCPCQPFSAAGKQEGFADPRHLWPEWFRLIRECHPPVVFGEQVAGAIKGGWLDAVYSDMEAQGYSLGSAVLPACGVGAPHIRQRLWFVADANATGRGLERSGGLRDGERPAQRDDADGCGAIKLGDANRERSQGRANGSAVSQGWQVPERSPRLPSGFWDACDWLPCTDGKARPVEPGSFPLAHGVQRRASKLRAYGNAIVPQAAAQFIKAFVAT